MVPRSPPPGRGHKREDQPCRGPLACTLDVPSNIGGLLSVVLLTGVHIPQAFASDGCRIAWELTRFVSLSMNTITAVVWWLLIYPMLHVMIPRKHRDRFHAFNRTQLLVSIHGLNFVLVRSMQHSTHTVHRTVTTHLAYCVLHLPCRHAVLPSQRDRTCMHTACVALAVNATDHLRFSSGPTLLRG